MISNEEQVRAAIAEQAGEWFVANDAGPLDARDAAALAEWLKASPVHIEEFLGVSVFARDLRELGADPEFSVDAVLARARAEDDAAAQLSQWARVVAAVRDGWSRSWFPAALTMGTCLVLSLGFYSLWNFRPTAHVAAPDSATALRFETRHGEQLARRLADGSIVHLNTDSAVSIRFSKAERVVELTSGQAEFEVAHEPHRAFRVVAGSAEVVAVGTQFDVRLEHDSTVVTVVEGRVAVGLSSMFAGDSAHSSPGRSPPTLQLGANQQIIVAEGDWPAVPMAVDAPRSTAW